MNVSLEWRKHSQEVGGVFLAILKDVTGDSKVPQRVVSSLDRDELENMTALQFLEELESIE